MKKIAILILFIFLPVTVIADSPAPPSSYIVTSSNGKYIFAMIAPVSKEEELFYWNEETQIRLAKIRDKYQQSGMYLANDSSKPIWSVNWYAFGSRLPMMENISFGQALGRQKLRMKLYLSLEMVTWLNPIK
jgi:hypothetical protein